MTQDTKIEIETHKEIIFELFPQEYIELQRELATGIHQQIVAIIERYPADEMDIKLAQIAAYCEVILEGDYNLTDRRALCKVLTEKLVSKREMPKSIILS